MWVWVRYDQCYIRRIWSYLPRGTLNLLKALLHQPSQQALALSSALEPLPQHLTTSSNRLMWSRVTPSESRFDRATIDSQTLQMAFTPNSNTISTLNKLNKIYSLNPLSIHEYIDSRHLCLDCCSSLNSLSTSSRQQVVVAMFVTVFLLDRLCRFDGEEWNHLHKRSLSSLC